MDSVQHAATFYHRIKPWIPKRHRAQFRFGFQALSLKPLVSLNANARMTIRNVHTAESKMYRLTKNRHWNHTFPQIMVRLGMIKEDDLINVDFSDFHGTNVLVFARQTCHGRAIPVYVEHLEYPVERGSQNTFVIAAVKRFHKLVGVPIRLVFDRWLCHPESD